MHFIFPRTLLLGMACIPGLFPLSVLAQTPSDTLAPPRLAFHGYGTVNYHYFDWQTDPSRRARLDLERVALEATFRLRDKLWLEAELEIEHGGTGSAMEFDRFEEFGEFESEVEKGGEVEIESFHLIWSALPSLKVLAGHLFVPMGMALELDEPTDYFTVQRSETESALLPSLWHENGAGLDWHGRGLRLRGVIVNGLDGTAFSSGSWIARGRQGRFEGVNAENLAVALRLDAHLGDWLLGASVYGGNTTDNRPKPDLQVSTRLGIYELHGEGQFGPFLARALLLHGFLENSAALSRANRALPNTLNVKRNPVAYQAFGTFGELGCDLLSLWRHGLQETPRADEVGLWLFGRYDYYDTMFRTVSGMFDNPRWERATWTGGLNLKAFSDVILKSEIAYRQLGTAADNREITYSTGLGIVF